MKNNNILRISILPLILFVVVSFTNVPPQKGKGKNENESKEQNGDKEKDPYQKRNNDNHSSGNNNEGKDHNSGNNQDKVYKGHDSKSDRGNDNPEKGNSNKEDSDHGKMSHGNGNSKNMNGKRDADINWNLNDFANRKYPKDQKKVTICHHPSSDGSNAVTISVSENAVKAHMNHGDQIGSCNINYSDRWSSNYVKSRENVYNTYENTYETMSYSESLLKIALDRLLGIRSNLDRSRSTLSPQEVQRREGLVLDLQNNVDALQNQVGVTRQSLDNNVNIIIKL